MRNPFRAITEKFPARQNRKTTLFKGKSAYRVLVIEEDAGAKTRIMYAGNRRFVAGIRTDSGFPLYSPYFLADIFVPHPASLLFLGGGPNAVPTYIWNTRHPKRTTVIDRDALTISLSRKYFSAPKNPHYRMLSRDAADYLRSYRETFDIIYLDLGLTRKRVDSGDLTWFATRTALLQVRKHLEAEGVLLSNIIARMNGEEGRFLRTYLRLHQSVFPGCYLFSEHKDKPQKLQLHTIVALNRNRNIQSWYNRLLQDPGRPLPVSVYHDLFRRLHGVG